MAIDAPQLGVQGMASWPTGATRSEFTSRTGYGLGLFAGWEVGAGRVLRLAYDGTWYPDGGVSGGSGLPTAAYTEGDQNCRSHSVTAQYLYYPSGDTEGVYFKVGLGGMNDLTKTKTTVTIPGSQPADLNVLNESGIKLACVAGLGYDFNKNWGVLAQYSFITVNNHTLGTAQTGISYRF